jgi:hypothetical protein
LSVVAAATVGLSAMCSGLLEELSSLVEASERSEDTRRSSAVDSFTSCQRKSRA